MTDLHEVFRSLNADIYDLGPGSGDHIARLTNDEVLSAIKQARSQAIDDAIKVVDAERQQQLDNWMAATDPKHIEFYRHGTAVLAASVARLEALKAST